MSCHFVPPYLLRHVAASAAGDAARCGRATLDIDEALRLRRSTVAGSAPHAERPGRLGRDARWVVHDAGHTSALPGRPARREGDPVSGDLAVDEAAAGLVASLALFREVHGRDSYDGRGATVLATVHYEHDYDNAFWDGSQLVFGDGDGRVFDRFTKPVDVLAHELTHAVTQYAAGLVYQGQSGALNEHVSDVFAACVKQRLLGQHDPSDADWLIGEGIFLPGVNGRALRSMAAPGTAYDDPVLGRDPQVGHLSEFVHTTDDNGGVHLNSGIPNRAFHLAATRLGGASWSGAGAIWYSALVSGLRPDTDFVTFAAATVEAAKDVSRQAGLEVARAWTDVGVTPASAPRPAERPVPQTRDAVVAVRRSGGFAGRTVAAEVRLGDDPRTPEVEELLGRIDTSLLRREKPQPDRYVYAFSLCGQEISVAEQALTPELSRLAHLLLDE